MRSEMSVPFRPGQTSSWSTVLTIYKALQENINGLLKAPICAERELQWVGNRPGVYSDLLGCLAGKDWAGLALPRPWPGPPASLALCMRLCAHSFLLCLPSRLPVDPLTPQHSKMQAVATKSSLRRPTLQRAAPRRVCVAPKAALDTGLVVSGTTAAFLALGRFVFLP